MEIHLDNQVDKGLVEGQHFVCGARYHLPSTTLPLANDWLGPFFQVLVINECLPAS